MTDQKIITEMTTAEMVAEYNQLTGKSIKKFSDRKTGERQLESARKTAEIKSLFNNGGAASAAPAAEVKTKPVAAKKPAAKSSAKAKPVAAKKPAAKKSTKEKSPAADRSTAVAASWTDKSVAAARAIRTNVSVAGVQYRSVKEAFEKLDLPLGQHIKFRMELKAEGVKTFEHDGKKYNFKTVVQQELA